MSVFVPPAASLADSRALFIHNWRCAGSTMNSLLSANFGSKYAKVGTQFTDFGWPDYSLPELLTVRQVRNKSLAGGVLGGHLCAGVEVLLVVHGTYGLMRASQPFQWDFALSLFFFPCC